MKTIKLMILVLMSAFISASLTACDKEETHLFDESPENCPSDEDDNTNEDNTISSPSGVINEHGYVDLGLSVKWATCNIGANTPTGYGYYFSWGDIEPNRIEDDTSYKQRLGHITESIAGNPSYDAATANWGAPWRMPTKSEGDELEKCEWTGLWLDGIFGFKLTGPNGNSIFLPAGGIMTYSGSMMWLGQNPSYWTATPTVCETCFGAYWIQYKSADNAMDRYTKMPVRPIIRN